MHVLHHGFAHRCHCFGERTAEGAGNALGSIHVGAGSERALDDDAPLDERLAIVVQDVGEGQPNVRGDAGSSAASPH